MYFFKVKDSVRITYCGTIFNAIIEGIDTNRVQFKITKGLNKGSRIRVDRKYINIEKRWKYFF